MLVGYHASHEQLPPARLLRLAQRAEQAGFGAVLSSDHLMPWSQEQGESGFAWSWLGAVAATTSLRLGVVSAPGDRYHPAVLAQAIATVAELSGGRLTIALGSGQALNEHVTGAPWPRKAVRNARLAECADVVRRLLEGGTVDHDGLVTVRAARVYSRPAEVPPLLAAALSPGTAAEVAAWADGLITVHAPDEQVTPVVDAYRESGGRGPVHVQLHLSWAPTRDAALEQARSRWRANVLPPLLNEELELPEQMDAASEHVPAAALADSVLPVTSAAELREVLGAYRERGVERVYLHDVGPDQEAFVDACGDDVLR